MPTPPPHAAHESFATGKPVVVLAQCEGETDHFAGVDEALAARGLVPLRLLADQAPVPFGPDVKVVVVKDTHTFIAGYALEQGRRVGAVSVLLMDGLVEWRNTFLNPRSGEAFLRPAPVDVVACAGRMDERTLRALGNDAVATGLPRLASIQAGPLPPERRIMVASANQPAFGPEERARLLAALDALRESAAAANVEVRWRLTGGLDVDLGVDPDRRPLREALADVRAVITTPSTLMVEAMLAGRPTALLHPHPTPLWQPAAWVWRGVEPEAGPDPSLPGLEWAGLHADLQPLARRLASPQTLLRQLLAPSPEQMERQRAILGVLHGASAGAPAALAELCARLAAHPRRASHGRRMPSLVRRPRPERADPSRPRVVNMVYCEGSPVGGVRTWAARLAEAFAAEDLGYDVRTLLVAPDPAALPEPVRDADGPLKHACLFDPTADHTTILRTVREAVEALDPAIVLPNYTDLCYMVATQLGRRGVRTLAVAHTDDDSYRRLMARYDRWDGAAAVSAACATWVGPLAGQRPWETIIYGVPVAPSPRRPEPSGPVRIVYAGRMEQAQKRVFDLFGLIDGLEARRIAYELHVVGDGPALDAWKRELARRAPRRGRVVCHGRRDPQWVHGFLPTADVSVLMSDFEGTSLSMLEAMGAGVVPAVTAVDSGVGEWVRDGHNGVVVPRRSPDAMAARLAALAADRALLARLGEAAWRTARERVCVRAMARRYRDLFDVVRARPADTRPTDLGLRPLEMTRWRKTWADDPEAAERWIEGRLREAGYRSIAHDRPTPGCEAVLVRAGSARPDPDEVRRWRRAGLGVAFSPHLGTTAFEALADRVRRLLDEAVRAGARRIAVYGIGQHTRRLAPVFQEARPIVGFVDDRPPAWGAMFGRPVVTPDRALDELRPDAVLLSSDAWEPRLWEQAAPLRAAGVRVIPIYGTYADAPASAPAMVA